MSASRLLSSISGVVLTTLSFSAFAEPKTPSHVFQMATNVQNQLRAIIEADGKNLPEKMPSVQVGKMPVHVIFKAREINEKIIRLESTLKLDASARLQIPTRAIVPSDVFVNVKALSNSLDAITAQKNITYENATFTADKTPSNVYETLMRVSILLDALNGPIDPNKAFRNSQIIESEVDAIMAHMGKTFTGETPKPEMGSKPYDVNIEAFMNLYRIAKIERDVDLKAVHVSDFPIGKITPADVFDTTNNILAELNRIKTKIGLFSPTEEFKTPKGKKTYQVLQVMQRIGLKLSSIVE